MDRQPSYVLIVIDRLVVFHPKVLGRESGPTGLRTGRLIAPEGIVRVSKTESIARVSKTELQ